MFIPRSFTWKIHKSPEKVCLNLFLNIKCSHPSKRLLVSCFSHPTLCILIPVFPSLISPLCFCAFIFPPPLCSYQLFHFVLLSRSVCPSLPPDLPCTLQVISNSSKEYSHDFCAISYKLGSVSGNCSNCSGRTLKFKWDIFCKIDVLLLHKLYALLPSLELQLLYSLL